MARILVIDDDPGVSRAVSALLTSQSHEVRIASSGDDGLRQFLDWRPDLAILDLTLPDMTGIDVLKGLRKADPRALAIFLTAFGTVRTAVEAIRSGGFDFLTKPFDNDELLLTVDRCLDFQRLGRRVADLEEGLEARESFAAIIGHSQAIRDALTKLSKIAKVDTPLLLLGESGTGKELAATSVHRHSSRSKGPFVALNCAAIPSSLADSELFGHERGSFTDARDTRVGKFEQADGGTLFLDEVGELPLDSQAKLLRILEDGLVWRIGSRKPIKVNTRLIAATNRDLCQMVKQERFRSDLLFRLNAFPVVLPPLRDRPEDIPLLVDHLTDRLSRQMNLVPKPLTDRAFKKLANYEWPGNIRELENVLCRAMILAESNEIDDIPLGNEDVEREPITAEEDFRGSLAEVAGQARERVERFVIEDAMRRSAGNRTKAAVLLGISRRTLFSKMKRFSLVDGDQDQD